MEDFNIMDNGVQKLTTKLRLVVNKLVIYKVTTKQEHSHSVAANEVCVGYVKYIRTCEGWMHPTIVID